MHILHTDPVQFLKCWQGEFVYQSRSSSVVYHFLYSRNLMLDSGMILKGEIRCWSLSGIEGLTTVHILYATPCICWQQYSVVEIVRKANKKMNRRQ